MKYLGGAKTRKRIAEMAAMASDILCEDTKRASLGEYQSRRGWVDVSTDAVNKHYDALVEAGKELHVELGSAFDATTAKVLALSVFYLPNASLKQMIKLLKSRHKKVRGDLEKIKELFQAGILAEVMTREDMPDLQNWIERKEKQQKDNRRARKCANEQANAIFKKYKRNEKGSGGGGGGSGGAAPAAGSGGRGGGGGGGGSGIWTSPVTLDRNPVKQIIARLKPPGSHIAINHRSGAFVVYFEGEYVQSYSWFSRPSTTTTLRIALGKAWDEYEDAEDGEMPDRVRSQIEHLDISEHNVAENA
jgi:hypothetical protein